MSATAVRVPSIVPSISTSATATTTTIPAVAAMCARCPADLLSSSAGAGATFTRAASGTHRTALRRCGGAHGRLRAGAAAVLHHGVDRRIPVLLRQRDLLCVARRRKWL